MALAALQNTPATLYFVSGSAHYTLPGQFQAALAGAVGSNYQILVSTNLQTWSALTTITMTNATSIFTDNAPNSNKRYYRAKPVP
jgi:hypothetical protein